MVESRTVSVIWFPKVLRARSLSPFPRALEIIEEPPIPIAIPRAAIKKDTGRTTFIAAIAIEPIQFPTKKCRPEYLETLPKLQWMPELLVL